MIRLNNNCLTASETIDAQTTGVMTPVMRLLIAMATWQHPTCVEHKVIKTPSYFKERFEVLWIDQSDPDTEWETMIQYDRQIVNGKLTEELAHKHMFGISDAEYSRTVETDKMFPSDSDFFGFNLIESWDNYIGIINQFPIK